MIRKHPPEFDPDLEDEMRQQLAPASWSAEQLHGAEYRRYVFGEGCKGFNLFDRQGMVRTLVAANRLIALAVTVDGAQYKATVYDNPEVTQLRCTTGPSGDPVRLLLEASFDDFGLGVGYYGGIHDRMIELDQIRRDQRAYPSEDVLYLNEQLDHELLPVPGSVRALGFNRRTDLNYHEVTTVPVTLLT